MESTYAERRRPSRETVGSNGYDDDDITIPHRNVWQPARKLQETRALLASPGPLESMLKTTTETGDIGVFSIGPSRSSSQARTPLHPRTNTGGNMPARSTSTNATERRYYRDDRRGLPSHRDTTSEIISLYGNGQRSMPNSFSRGPDDSGPRSYSLTSCSSRYMSDQKSTGTWDSRSSGGSGGVLARPRSPYPYHTRLKRPGVRPSSPAVTLNGSIDYSRMVEIERPSYRTYHRSYNRSYPPNPPRHPHQRYRPYDTRVARSLPGDGDAFMMSPYRNVPNQTQLHWASRPRDQFERSSSDQSFGVSSITSIVQRYGSPVAQPVPRQPPISRTGSFYYDYSEDYQEAPMTLPFLPVSPMPRRVPSMYRPVVLDDKCEPIIPGGPDVNDEPNDEPAGPQLQTTPASPALSYIDVESRSPTACENLPEEDMVSISPGQSRRAGSANRVNAEPAPDSASCSQLSRPSSSKSGELETGTAADTGAGESSSDEPNAPTTALVRNEGQYMTESNRSLFTEPPANVPPLALSQSVGNITEDAVPETPSVTAESPAYRSSASTKSSSGNPDTPTASARRRSNVYSLQPGLLDLKSFVQDLDDAGLLHDVDVTGSTLDNSNTSSTPAILQQGSDVHPLLARTDKFLEAGSERIMMYHSNREPAVSHAITRLKADVMSERRQSSDTSSSVILAPKPVSPARQLRLRSSVSKLMKALPPLPYAPAKVERRLPVTPMSDRKLPDLPAPPRISLSGSRQFRSTVQPPLINNDLQGTNKPGVGTSDPALTGKASKVHNGANCLGRDVYGDIWDTHFGRRDDSAIPSSGAVSSGITGVKGPEASRPDFPRAGKTHLKQVHHMVQRGEFKSSTMRVKPVMREGPSKLNSISQMRSTSLDTSRSTLHAANTPEHPRLLVDNRGRADNDLRPYRGLRKRLSDFKIRMTESRHRPVDWSASTVQVHETGEVIGMAVPVTSSNVSPESTEGTSNSNSGTEESASRGLKNKISRWLKSAKHAVNACKRLSSSTGGTSLDTDF